MAAFVVQDQLHVLHASLPEGFGAFADAPAVVANRVGGTGYKEDWELLVDRGARFSRFWFIRMPVSMSRVQSGSFRKAAKGIGQVATNRRLGFAHPRKPSQTVFLLRERAVPL